MAKDSMLSGMGNLSPDAAKMSDGKSRISLKDLSFKWRTSGSGSNLFGRHRRPYG